MFGKSATRHIVVTRAEGLHARPCLAISRAARQFRARMELRCGNQQADARSVLELLTLGAGQGTEIVLYAKGPDADEAVDAVIRLFYNDFGLSGDGGLDAQ